MLSKNIVILEEMQKYVFESGNNGEDSGFAK
jgi:hypothetical protein